MGIGSSSLKAAATPATPSAAEPTAGDASPVAVSTPRAYAPSGDDRGGEIFEAIDAGDAAALATLLQEGVHLGVTDDDSNTPLHKAAEGEIECAKVLVAHVDAASGAFEARNVEGETCLMVAIKYEDATLCSIFVTGGALCTQEAIERAHAVKVPEVISALTGEAAPRARAVAARAARDDVRRVSVKGENVDDFTKTFNNEQSKEVSRRNSVKGGQTIVDARTAIAEAMAEGFVEPPA